MESAAAAVLPPSHSAIDDTYHLQAVCSAIVFVLSAADLAIWSTTTARRGFEGVSLLLTAYSMAALSFVVSVWTLRAVRFASARLATVVHVGWTKESAGLPPPPPGGPGDENYKLQGAFSAVDFVVSATDLAIWGTTSVRAGYEGVSLLLAAYSMAMLFFVVSVWAFRAVRFAAVGIGARARGGHRQAQRV